MRSCALFLLVLAVGCGGPPPDVQPPEPPVVTVANPVEKSLDSFNEYTGYLRAVETQEVRAQVTGYLKVVYFETPTGGVLNNGLVKKGDKLYEIDPEPYDAALASAKAEVAKAAASVLKAKADVGTARASVTQSTADLDRATKAGAATSQQDLDRYKAAFDTAKAGFQSSESAVTSAEAAVKAAEASVQKAKFDRDNCTITSSVTGVARISRTLVTPGNLVQAGQTVLCRITSVDPIHVYFDVDELASLEYRRKVDRKEIGDPRSEASRLKCYVGLRDEKAFPHPGVIDFADPEIRRGTGTREVRGVLDNKDLLMGPGDSVRVRVEAGKPKAYTLIPEVAVGTQQRQKFVYVVNDKDEVEFRPVALGAVKDVGGTPMQAVEGGLTAKDRIIVNGLLRVRPGAKVKPQAAPPATPGKPA